MILLLLALALAEEPIPEPIAAPEAETVPLEATPGELLVDAARRIDEGDSEGARVLIDEAIARSGQDLEEARYLRGMSYELEGKLELAETEYETALSTWPQGPRRDDTLFRRAAVEATRARWGDAVAVLDRLGSPERFTAEDQLRISLSRDAFLTMSGDAKAEKRLRKALSKIGPEVLPWYQARAYALLARHRVELARGVRFDTDKQNRLVKLANARLDALGAAEDDVRRVVGTKEPEWILDTMITLGEGYEQLADDLLTAPPPRSLPEVLLPEYQEALRKKVEATWLKADAHYREGIDLALRIRWRSERMQRLQDAHDAVTAKVDALWAADETGNP